MTTTPQEYRDRAAAHDRDANESFERCDTDGFMSQWASGLTAAQDRLQADILDNGGRAMFLALFDTDGNLVPAEYIPSIYGRNESVWRICDNDELRGRAVAWFTPSKARRPGVARTNDAKKGYYVGYVMAPAEAALRGGNVCTVSAVPVRTDGGFSRDAEIVDNGHGDTDIHRWYAIQDGSF